MPPVAKNKKVDSNTEMGNTSGDFNALNYPEESINSHKCLYCQLWTYLTLCSSVSVVIFEKVNADWVVIMTHTHRALTLLLEIFYSTAVFKSCIF